MTDPKTIKANVYKMAAKGVPESEIEEYIKAAKAEGRPDFSDVSRGYSRSKPSGGKTALGAMGAVVQGMTMGFGDELRGGLDAVFTRGGTMGGRYRKGRDQERATNREFESEHPVASPVLNAAGGIATALPLGGAGLARAGSGVVRRVGAGLLEGGAYGAVAGAGAAEGDLSDKARGGLIGGAAGAVLGGAVLPGAIAIGKGVRNLVAPNFERMAEKQANRIVGRAVLRDEDTPATLTARGGTFKGKPAIFADVGGENVLGAARGAHATPSKGKAQLGKALKARKEGRSERVLGDVQDAIGIAPRNVLETAEDLIATRKANAKPLYEAAHAQPINDPAIQKEILELMQLPDFKEAMARGARLSAVKRNPMKGNVPLKIGDLDYMKQGLDAVIESRSSGANALSRTEGRALRERLNELLDMVDAKHPEYAKARSTFKGDSELMDALESGRDFLKTRYEAIGAQLPKLSRGELELYRVGALDAVKGAIEQVKDGGDVVGKVLGNSIKQQQFKALVGDDAFKTLFGKVRGAEGRMVETESKLLGGSPTTLIANEQGDFLNQNIGEMASAARDVARGNVSGLLLRGAGALARRGQGNVGNVADNISKKMLVKPGTPEYAELMKALSQSLKTVVKTRTRTRVAQRVSAGQTGGATVR